MNNKLLTGTMRLAIIAGLLMVMAGGNTNAQTGSEGMSIDYKNFRIYYSQGKSVEILVNTPDGQQFLSNPVSTLRRQGVAVPQAAEAHWRAFIVALRRLGATQIAQAKGSRTSPGKEHFHYSFDKIEVLGTFADGNGNGTITRGARNVSARFLADPLATLRAEGVEVPSADGPAWRQMADALKELQGYYSRIKTMRNVERGPR